MRLPTLQKFCIVLLQEKMVQKSSKEKRDMEAWNKKQEEKRLQKELGIVNAGEEKKNKKKEKQLKNADRRPENNKQCVKEEQKLNKSVKKEQKKVETTAKTFQKIIKMDQLINVSSKKVMSKTQQKKLINNGVMECISAQDRVLILGEEIELDSQVEKVAVRGFSSKKQIQSSSIITNYEDLAYLLSNQITKVFIWADTLFAQGKLLLAKGFGNIAVLAEILDVPLFFVSSSRNYCNFQPTTLTNFADIFGPNLLKQWDCYCGGNKIILETGVFSMSKIDQKLTQIYGAF